MWRKTILATAIVGAGLASTTGAAFAGEDPGHDSVDSSNHHDGQGGHDGWGKDHDGHGKNNKDHKGHGKNGSCDNDTAAANGDGHTKQSGLLNVDDVQTIIPVNVCGNDVPINILGVQVPIQDLSGNVPILSGADHGSSNEAGVLG